MVVLFVSTKPQSVAVEEEEAMAVEEVAVVVAGTVVDVVGATVVEEGEEAMVYPTTC